MLQLSSYSYHSLVFRLFLVMSNGPLLQGQDRPGWSRFVEPCIIRNVQNWPWSLSIANPSATLRSTVSPRVRPAFSLNQRRLRLTAQSSRDAPKFMSWYPFGIHRDRQYNGVECVGHQNTSSGAAILSKFQATCLDNKHISFQLSPLPPDFQFIDSRFGRREHSQRQ